MTKKIKLKKYGDTLWHPESRLVFKSRKEKLVVGRLDDKEELIVDDKMVELSDNWNFKIDPDIVESAEESDEPVSSQRETSKCSKKSGKSEAPRRPEALRPEAEPKNSCLELILSGAGSKREEPGVKTEQSETSWQSELEKGSTLLRTLNRMYETQVQKNEKLEMELKKVKDERDEISNKMNAIKSLFS